MRKIAKKVEPKYKKIPKMTRIAKKSRAEESPGKNW